MNNTQEVMILWMEDIPLLELGSETAQSVVAGYREGARDYKYTMDALEELCGDELQKWLNVNRELNSLIESYQDDE